MANEKLPNDPHLDLDPLGLGEVEEEQEAPDGYPTSPRAAITKQLGEEQAEQIVATRRTPTDGLVEEALEHADPSIAAALKAMENEIAILRRQQSLTQAQLDDEADSGPGGYPHMYYKRPNDGGPMAGWIVVANGGASPKTGQRDSGTYSNLMSKGFKPLPRYGIVGPASDYAGSGKRPGDVYRTLLINGGAKDVPASQVLALRWHIQSPIPGTVFPQYEQVKHQAMTFECDEGDCSTIFSFLESDQTTAGACLDHLRSRHGYRWDEARAALENQGIRYRTGRVIQEAAAPRVNRALLELDEEEEVAVN